MTIYHTKKVQEDLDYITRVPKNLVINGNFNVWQRGVSFNPINPNRMYTADRWYIAVGSGTTGRRVVRPSSGGVRLNEIYLQRLEGDTHTTVFCLGYRFEAQETMGLRNKTLTLSFQTRRGEGYSAVDNILDVRVFTHEDDDEGFPLTASGLFPATGRTEVARITPSITEPRRRYSTTFTVPNDANQMMLWFYYNPTGTAGAGDIFRISEVQVELGDHFTSFEERPFAEELAMCQRYYQAFDNLIVNGYRTAGGWVYCQVEFNDTMRATPTVTWTQGAKTNAGDVATSRVDSNSCRLQASITATGYGSSVASATLDAEL